jgi:hypothetical protein
MHSGPTLRLTVRIAADGAARLHGTIRTPARRGTRLLKAARGGAQAACADADGDGAAGLVRLTATFRDVKTGARVPVVLVAAARDIVADGRYAVVLRVGQRTTNGEVFVKLLPSG